MENVEVCWNGGMLTAILNGINGTNGPGGPDDECEMPSYIVSPK